MTELSHARIRRRVLAMTLGLMLAPFGTTASAQTLREVLSFLLTNRSIPTGDFVADERAAAATRDAIVSFMLAELGTLPGSPSASGFTYRLDPELGTTIRASDNFGPLFTERALTAGALQMSFGLSYQQYRFETIDGRALRNGTLVATASKLRTENEPFDVETLALRLSTDAVTLQANLGVTDHLDVSAALPLLRTSLSGQRVDTYRGTRTVQASASGTAAGPGDVILRLKYNAQPSGGSGVAAGLEVHAPTGDASNLLGTGKASFMPRVIGSLERDRVAIHANAGYVFGGHSDEIVLGAAATYAPTLRLTLFGEATGRRADSIGRLATLTLPHPQLVDVETVRLTTADEPTFRVLAMAGAKWNVHSSWLLGVTVLHSLTEAGLNAGWTPTVTIDRSFGF